MVKPNDNTHFDKVLNVAEKSVEAWSKAYTKIEELAKTIDMLVLEIKDLNNIIREKPCITETVQHAQLETKLLAACKEIKTLQEALFKKLGEFEKDTKVTSQTDKQITLWLKFAVGIVMLVGSVVGVLLAIFNK